MNKTVKTAIIIIMIYFDGKRIPRDGAQYQKITYNARKQGRVPSIKERHCNIKKDIVVLKS